MNTLDRLDLIDRIARELQSRMTFSDINVYLKACGVDTSKPNSGVNSKWVYVKELLADEPEQLVLRMADELRVPHAYVVVSEATAVEASFWTPHHFRLFLSHLSSFKKKVADLQSVLRQYGVSAFVAHVDIEPTREWQDEIEAGLASMDALVAILMPGFKESNWTDQEVGYAVARGVLIVPVIRGLDPYGFIGKYQGFQVGGKTIGQVADDIFNVLVSSPKTRNRLLTCLVDCALQSTDSELGLKMLGHLSDVPDLPVSYLERFRAGAPSSAVFSAGPPLKRVDEVLQAHGLQEVAKLEATGLDALGEELPF